MVKEFLMLLALYIMTGVDTETWHEQASFFEAERLKTRADKRQKRKAKEALDIKVQQNPASADFVCQTCGRACKSRIGLYSHSRTHPQQH